MKDSTLDYYQRTLHKKNPKRSQYNRNIVFKNENFCYSSLPTLPEEGRMRSEVIPAHPVKAVTIYDRGRGYSSRGPLPILEEIT